MPFGIEISRLVVLGDWLWALKKFFFLSNRLPEDNAAVKLMYRMTGIWKTFYI